MTELRIDPKHTAAAKCRACDWTAEGDDVTTEARAHTEETGHETVARIGKAWRFTDLDATEDADDSDGSEDTGDDDGQEEEDGAPTEED